MVLTLRATERQTRTSYGTGSYELAEVLNLPKPQQDSRVIKGNRVYYYLDRQHVLTIEADCSLEDKIFNFWGIAVQAVKRMAATFPDDM